jgi:hypothetical protein
MGGNEENRREKRRERQGKEENRREKRREDEVGEVVRGTIFQRGNNFFLKLQVWNVLRQCPLLLLVQICLGG